MTHHIALALGAAYDLIILASLAAYWLGWRANRASRGADREPAGSK
jgi:hypothetical protein